METTKPNLSVLPDTTEYTVITNVSFIVHATSPEAAAKFVQNSLEGLALHSRVEEGLCDVEDGFDIVGKAVYQSLLDLPEVEVVEPEDD